MLQDTDEKRWVKEHSALAIGSPRFVGSPAADAGRLRGRRPARQGGAS